MARKLLLSIDRENKEGKDDDVQTCFISSSWQDIHRLRRFQSITGGFDTPKASRWKIYAKTKLDNVQMAVVGEMTKKTGELDIEQWLLDYLNSDYDSKVKSILQDKKFLEEWFLEKKMKLENRPQEDAENDSGLSELQKAIKTPDLRG